MSQHYFNKDGSYGLATIEVYESGNFNMIIPTGHWNQDMFELIAGWANEHRYDLAKHFSVNIHEINKGVCQFCTLDAERLDGQYLIVKEQSKWVALTPRELPSLGGVFLG
jgi:hypothetical protein